MRGRKRNSGFTNAHVRNVGFEFIEYLRESNQIHLTQRDELNRIYKHDFIDRSEGREPNFSKVLFVLRNCNRVRVTPDRHVFFNSNVRVLKDQWGRQENRQPSSSAFSQRNVRSPPTVAPVQGSYPPGCNGGVKARRSLARAILKKLDNERSYFVTDKNGIFISSEKEAVEGKLCYCVNQEDVYEWKLSVENRGCNMVYLTYYSPLHWTDCFLFEDSKKVTHNSPLCICPGEIYEVTMKFNSKNVGIYHATVAFEFKLRMEADVRPFHIVRFIEVEFKTQLAEELAPIEPYVPCMLSKTQTENFTVDEGQRPDNLAILHLRNEVPLDHYKCPSYINQLIEYLKNPQSFTGQVDQKKRLLKSPLDFYNYAERFQLLIYLEECQMEVDIKAYDKTNIRMKRDNANKKLLLLEVPGVSENRPSVLRGDHLLLTKTKDLQSSIITKYKGYVHRVELDQLKLGFSSKGGSAGIKLTPHLADAIHNHKNAIAIVRHAGGSVMVYCFASSGFGQLAKFIDNMEFTVEFTINRVPLRLQHRAVQQAVQHKLEEVLFPTQSQTSAPCANISLRLFDRSLESNHEQYTAVCNIVAGVSKPAPYLVFGPPGTGKTVTIVEAIKQVECSGSDVHILACAPSNSAADQLCEKILTHVDDCNVYRMYASSRNPEHVPENLRAASNLKGDVFEFLCKEELMKYKILITTVVTAGRLVTGGLPVGHFTHIFVDEAGHAVECETIIAVAGLLRAETGQLVLAGDPKQLGPILRSPFAIRYGLGVSLLERLMTKNSLYQKTETGYNNQYVTKLLCNYRSHRSILKIPNEMFYDGELKTCADEYSTSLYCDWEHLPKKNFPLIFHGVKGRDEREQNSPSFFNTSEITVVVDYLKKLLLSQAKKGIARISPKDIGIIAPYRKQVEKLRKAIRKCDKELRTHSGIDNLKVGSVEEFQGQERRVIIVSTVRSTSDYVELDEHFNIGFLKNEKRFNVAMTRARALLIVVGNPIILSTDPTWCRFIDYCTDEDGCTGFKQCSVEGTEEVLAQLQALNFHLETEVKSEESGIQQHINPEWRNEL